MDKIDYSSLAKDLKYLDRAIPREKWLNTNLTPRMTEVFLCYFESSRILFTIRLADTELHIIEVMVKTIHSYQSEFTDIIHRSMPYPVLLFQNFKGKFFQVSVVESHTNKYNTCREVVDQRSSSRWVERNKYDYLLRLISKSIPSFTSRSSFLATISQLLEDFNKEIRFGNAINALIDAKSRNVSVFIRAGIFKTVPEELRAFTHENKYLANPVSIIDKRISWFGAPLSKADFVVEGRKVDTLCRPIFRFAGTSCAKSLFGFLKMNRTITAGIDIGDVEQQDHYSTFSSYVSAELHCNKCGSTMVLRKSRSGKFFLACSNRQNCDHTELVSVDALTNYMYFNNNKGKHCPVDGTSLEAKIGRYGIYVQCCNGTNKHFYKLDEI